jgi:pyridoxamine 5'-phosphate oxidase
MRENTPAPDCSHSLDAVLSDIWARLLWGPATAKAPCHLMTIGSIGADGAPDQRIMVLRHTDRDAATLRFHTDARSPKAGLIADAAPISALNYDAIAKVQLRLTGIGHIERHTAETDAAWAASNPSSRRCYLGAPPSQSHPDPTSGLPAQLEGRIPELVETLPGRDNFAILRIVLTQLEWLYLAHDGHRRARFTHNAQHDWQGQWLTP